jgi:lipid-A-disaccharide synthase
MESNQPLKIFICAGEVSGDMHAAIVMRALRRKLGRPIRFRGFGGDAMAAEGAELLYHTDRTAMVGLTPVLINLPFLMRMKAHLQREILAWKPDIVLTIDYPGMNLRLAEFAHQRGFRTAHYVCPQVWAWKRGRIPKIARIFDVLLCFFPFEPALFSDYPLRAVFIGHPLVDEVASTFAEPLARLPWQGTHQIALLPGSRSGEITRLLPRLLEAAKLLETRLGGDCSFIIPTPTVKMRALGESVLATCTQRPARVFFVDGQARQVLRQAHVAAVASGTATLEACMMGCPTVLVYAASAVTAYVARRVITGVRYLGLANIVAGREIMPELLQDEFTPQRLSELLYLYLTDAGKRAQMCADLSATTALLGPGKADERAAAEIAALLER